MENTLAVIGLAVGVGSMGIMLLRCTFKSESSVEKEVEERVRKEVARLLPPCGNCGSLPYERETDHLLSAGTPHLPHDENSR